MSVRTERTTSKHVEDVLKNQRIFDEALIQRAGIDSDATVREFVAKSQVSWSAYAGKELLYIAGILSKSLLDRNGYLWVLTSDLVEEHKFMFVRHSQRKLEELRQDYDTIHCHCDSRFERSIKWLKWLGFTAGPPIQGDHGVSMIPFSIKGETHG